MVIVMAKNIVFTKEQILKRTSKFVRIKGIDALNARSLCKYIGCSTQPLFRNFESMEDLKKELRKYLYGYYNDFIGTMVDPKDYLSTMAYAYVLFAYRESNIFDVLFMNDLAGSRTIYEVLVSNYDKSIIESIPAQYGLTKKQAEKLYRDVRFYIHGLSCQIACHSIVISEQEIKGLIKNVIKVLKKGIL